jgi:TctA family transporter
MDLFSNLSLGFGVVLTPINLFYAFTGCFLGTLIGVLPGIGPLTTIAMLLPFTFTLPPLPALIMLAGVYYGSQYGGSTTAILVNLPGETSSVVTVLDGYQMARQGRAGKALAAAALGSFFAGSIGTLLLAAFAAPLTKLAFKFGAAEYFALMTLGLIGAVVMASGSLLKAIAMILLGLLLGLVGADVNSGVTRFGLGIPELSDGIGIVAVAMGVFGYGEIIKNLEQSAGEGREVFAVKVRGLFPNKQDYKDMTPAVLRGTALGCILGVLPGSGHVLSSFASYAFEKTVKMKSGEIPLGKGNIRGVAAPEAANNAGAQTSFIPLLTLGIPSTAVMAIMVAAMTIQNIQPGPHVMINNPKAFLGSDCLHVDRQPHAGDFEPASRRHMDPVSEGPLSTSVSRYCVVCCDRGVLHHQQHLRHLDGGDIRFHRLRVHQARLRARALSAGLYPGPTDGRKPAPCSVGLSWQLEYVRDASFLSRPLGGGRAAVVDCAVARRQKEAQRGICRRVNLS